MVKTLVFVTVLLSAAVTHAQAPQQTLPAKVEFLVQPTAAPHETRGLTPLIPLAWPITVMLGLLVFRQPLERFLSSIGGRITKFSLGSVSLEIATAHQFTVPTLDQLRDPSSVPVGDSSGALRSHVTQAAPADYGVANLGMGDQWLTSRLFLLAALAEPMRGSRYIVFVDTENGAADRFVGVASCRSLRYMLAMRSPWLESAFATAYQQAVAPGQWGASTIVSKSGAVSPSVAGQIVSSFIQAVQSLPPAPAANAVVVALSGGRQERAEWVTPDLLIDTLGTQLQRNAVNLRDEARATDRVKRLLKAEGPMVAVVGPDGRFEKLVNRTELADLVAKEVIASA
jgi:hypothetical protein